MHFQTLLGTSGEHSILLAVNFHLHQLTGDPGSNQSCGAASHSHGYQQGKQVNVPVVSFQAVPPKCRSSFSAFRSREGVKLLVLL